MLFVGGVGGGKTRVTIKRELGKNVGELPVDKLPPDNGDSPLPLFALPLACSVTFDTWNRLRDGLANGLRIGDGNGDLSRLSQLKRLDLDFFTLTVGSNGTLDNIEDIGDDDNCIGVVDDGNDDDDDVNSRMDGDGMLGLGDDGFIVVVLSKFDAVIVSVSLVGDVRIMF